MRSRSLLLFAGACCLSAASPTWSQCPPYEALTPQGDPFVTYGNDISIDGEWAAIGADQDDDNNTGTHERFSAVGYKTGSVFIRHFENGQWVDTQKIRCPNRNPFGGDNFGFSLALQGTTLLIGSPNHQRPQGHLGSVFVYERMNTTWNLVTEIVIADHPPGGENFGWSVALDGDTAAIGAIGVDSDQGAIFVFERVDGVWTQTARLQASGAERDSRVGSTIAIQQGTILAGAKDAANHWGAAWIFEKVAGEWMETARLQPSDLSPGDEFGYEVCIDGDEALVSGQMDDLGRVYVFPRRFGVWQEIESSSFTTEGGRDNNHHFGRHISIEGDVALIAAPSAARLPSGSEGIAYLFYRRSGQWIQGPTLAPSEARDSDHFGDAVALAGGTAFVHEQVNRFEGWLGEVFLFEVGSCRPALDVTATCPDGGPLRVDWSNATPNRVISLFFSTGMGQATLPPGSPCAGTVLDLDPNVLVLFYTHLSDSAGGGQIRTQAGSAACGGYMQLLDVSNCTTSNAAHVE